MIDMIRNVDQKHLSPDYPCGCQDDLVWERIPIIRFKGKSEIIFVLNVGLKQDKSKY